MNRGFRYLLLFAFVAIALFVVSEMSDDAEAASVTWKQTAGALASNNVNWENGTAPTTGDDVYFTALSTAACTWDVTAQINRFSGTAGYSGTITLSSAFNIGAGGFRHLNGYLACASKVITCAGEFYYSGDALSGTPALVMTGSGKTLSPMLVLSMGSLRISGDTTISGTQYVNSGTSLIIDSGKTLTLTSPSYIIANFYNGYTFTNSGIITGTGIFKGWVYDANVAKTIGVINSPVSFELHASAAASRILSLAANVVLGNTVTVQSLHATNTITLNLAGYTISSTSMTVGVRAVLSGSGEVSCSSNFDSYNGTTSGSWSLTMTGTNPWIKTPAANTVNGLTWTGTNLRLASSLNITKTFYVGGTYTLGTKTVTVGTATNVTITAGNTWTVPATRYWGRLNVTGTLTASTPVSVWANSTCSVNGTVASTITLHVKQMTTFNGAVGNLYIEVAYRTHFYANGTWTAIYWNLTTTWNFHPEGLMPYTSPVYSKAQMRVIDPTNNAYYIEVTRFDTNVGFSIMVHGWAAETWEFTVTSTSATATLFTYNIVTPDVETDPVLIYLNGVYLDAKNMTLGSFTMNDVFNSTMGTRDYLIVCSDFGPTTPTTTFDYGIMGMCLVILSILTFASFRFQPLFIINGFVWITVAMLIIEPVQATIALLCLGVGLIFAMWGAYRALLG